ncbi:MAG: AAA family ATPase [Candidatus Polarisedimenticolaceae bacterium]|nr:AAA family ATPase [Candidatus Polarisedimenticolaceae bacterium]
MTIKTIHTLKITNFKSIDSLEIKGLSPFSIFAGPNGSGKSNFFDALDFIGLFLRSGIETALRSHGGFANIHSEKRRATYSRKFSFEIECDLPEATEDQQEKLSTFHYSLNIHDLNGAPKIEEHLSVNGTQLLTREKGKQPVIKGEEEKSVERFPETYSALLLFFQMPLAEFLRNLNLYRIDPIGAKEPDQSDSDPTRLERKGHNLASVLSRMEDDSSVRETILEWMEMIVPGIEKIQTEQQQLESKTAILFKEQGTRRRFPAHMVSDGTVYSLCLLVAVLDSPTKFGVTLIEEPERGLHPKAIRELIDLMRQQASPGNPIWLTTHSESVVRELELAELILVDKIGGRTKMKCADSGNLTQDNLAPLNLDEAWLSNLLDGGLPW